VPTTAEPRHPIGVVAERTALTPDVLRVWERRYAVVKPARSRGGQRLYSDADIERLSLLHRATQGGHGISHVASLSNAKLGDLVRAIETGGERAPARAVPAREAQAIVDQALICAEALDPVGLESVLRRTVARYGIVFFMDSVAAPFMRRMGDEWHAGRITYAQEHLATAAVHRVVSDVSPVLTDGGNPTIVVATLEGERHANGALMAAATAASEGWRVIYLGADLPPADIAEAALRTGARAVGISVVLAEKKARTATSLRELEKRMPANAKLLVGGTGSKALKRPSAGSETVFIETLEDLRTTLAAIAAGVRR
jgi:DNA-binding transcriptional MerR regulator/methylmalonyl-CoA mutase cobalamin-binding subunit